MSDINVDTLDQKQLKEAVKRFCRTDEAADNLVKFINQEKIQAGFNELHMVKYRIDNNLNANTYVLHRYGSLQKRLEENMK